MGKQARQESRRSQRAVAAEAARRAERRRRLIPISIAVAVVVICVGVVVGITVGGSSGGSSTGVPAGTAIFPETNHQHVTGSVTYNRVPPAGGPHNAVWLNCGVYSQPVPNENAVHSLEHGTVWITYRPDLPASQVNALQEFVATHYVGSQRYLILSPYPGLPSPVVASAWGAQLRLNGPFDPRLVAFVNHYAGGAQGGEPGGPCTGGTGSPQA